MMSKLVLDCSSNTNGELIDLLDLPFTTYVNSHLFYICSSSIENKNMEKKKQFP
jgi:hypothetical protein